MMLKLLFLLTLASLVCAFPKRLQKNFEVDKDVEIFNDGIKKGNSKENLLFGPYFRPFRNIHAPIKRQYIFHPYNGYIPIPFKNGKAVSVEGKKYEHDPFQGFVPVKESGEEKSDVEQVEDGEKLSYHPYFGFISGEKLKEEEEKESKIRYNYHPHYGFVRIPESESEDDAKESFYFHPYHGYIPESKVDESSKLYKGIDKTKKFVYTSHLGYLPEDQSEKKYLFNFEKGFVLDSEESGENNDQNKIAEDATRFYYHPYLGYVPKDKINDDKILKDVNLEDQFVFHPIFGFVPETPLKETKSV